MKNQGFFSSKDKSKKLKCRLLQFLFGPFRVNVPSFMSNNMSSSRLRFFIFIKLAYNLWFCQSLFKSLIWIFFLPW